MHRFFVSPDCINADQVNFQKDTSHQINRVLRLAKGETVIVLDNQDHEFVVRLDQVEGEHVSGVITSQQGASGEPTVFLTLFLCLTQREKFEWALQKCTEVGVSAFYPVISSRSLVQDRQNTDRKTVRWEKILREASEQCGRGRIPTLGRVMSLSEAFNSPQASHDTCLVAWEQEHSLTLRQALSKRTGNAKPGVSILVGPEGGLSSAEVALARQCGWLPVSLGERILRMETAAVVACVLALHESET
jgi:16S rRNA (uracil1498-N3)-methyltransferase